MPTQGELMRASLPAEAARMLGATLDTVTETATGTNQATAFVLTANMTIFGTVAASTGALLPSATGSGPYFTFNNGANTLTVYPATGETINASTANTGYSVSAGKGARFDPHGNTWMANLSA